MKGAKSAAGFFPYVLGSIVMMVLLSTLVPATRVQSLWYTEFKHKVQANEVADVVINDVRIRGTFRKDDQPFDAIRIDDPSLVAELERHGVNVRGELATDWWSTLGIWLLPLLFIVFWTQSLRGMAGQGTALAFGRSHPKIYAEADVKVTFADVAGIDDATEELREIVDFLRNPPKYTALGGRIPKGVLLVGPPGTGKTLLARRWPAKPRVPFFSLSGSGFVEMFVGVGAARVRDLFAQAESRAPCIIFIDELDALGKTRVASPLGTHEEREQTLNQLLAEMDGFDPRKGVIVISATNRPRCSIRRSCGRADSTATSSSTAPMCEAGKRSFGSMRGR